MITMTFVTVVIYGVWLRYNWDLLWPSIGFLALGLAAFGAIHYGLVLFVVATAIPINTIMAVIALILLVYSFFGFWPHLEGFHIRSWSDFVNAVHNPRKGISVLVMAGDAMGVVRMLHWDVIRPVERLSTGGQFSIATAEGIVFNFGLALWGAAIATLSLSLLYYLIPAGKREGWSWLTAPFYPEKPSPIRFIFRKR